jgi:hypothetical protein
MIDGRHEVLLQVASRSNSMELLDGLACRPDGVEGYGVLADLLASKPRDLDVRVDKTGVAAVVHRKLGDAAFVGACPVFGITTGPLGKSHNMSPSDCSRRHSHPLLVNLR